MSSTLGLRLPLMLALAAILGLVVTTVLIWQFSGAGQLVHTAPTETPTPASGGPDQADKTRTPEAQDVLVSETTVSQGANASPSEAISTPPAVATWLEAFEKQFVELAGAGNPGGLERFLYESIRKAPSLEELLPVLLRCLEGFKGEGFAIDQIGQGVWGGLRVRKDLKDHAEAVNAAFLATESPTVRVALASALSAANEGRDTMALTRHIERLLIDRKPRAGAPTATDPSWYWERLIGAHVAMARSMLDTIEFVESLRPGGLPDAEAHRFWSDYASGGFFYKRYDLADVPKLVDHLMAHTTERLNSTPDRAIAAAVLKKIWENFREDEAYNRGLQHAQGLSDAETRKVWDEVLAHWKAKKPAD